MWRPSRRNRGWGRTSTCACTQRSEEPQGVEVRPVCRGRGCRRAPGLPCRADQLGGRGETRDAPRSASGPAGRAGPGWARACPARLPGRPPHPRCLQAAATSGLASRCQQQQQQLRQHHVAQPCTAHCPRRGTELRQPGVQLRSQHHACNACLQLPRLQHVPAALPSRTASRRTWWHVDVHSPGRGAWRSHAQGLDAASDRLHEGQPAARSATD